MFRQEETFVSKCLHGDVDIEQIDDFVDAWHDGKYECELPEYLGMSDEEYFLWMEKPLSLRFILAARKREIPLQDVLVMQQNQRIAARAGSIEDANLVIEWLKKTGRM